MFLELCEGAADLAFQIRIHVLNHLSIEASSLFPQFGLLDVAHHSSMILDHCFGLLLSRACVFSLERSYLQIAVLND